MEKPNPTKQQDYYERLVAYIEELAGDWQGSKNYYLAASARQFAEALRTYREENNRFVPPASNPSARE
jgi:hypothetical protein